MCLRCYFSRVLANIRSSLSDFSQSWESCYDLMRKVSRPFHRFFLVTWWGRWGQRSIFHGVWVFRNANPDAMSRQTSQIYLLTSVWKLLFKDYWTQSPLFEPDADILVQQLRSNDYPYITAILPREWTDIHDVYSISFLVSKSFIRLPMIGVQVLHCRPRWWEAAQILCYSLPHP